LPERERWNSLQARDLLPPANPFVREKEKCFVVDNRSANRSAELVEPQRRFFVGTAGEKVPRVEGIIPQELPHTTVQLISRPKMLAICGWFNDASTCASRSNRAILSRSDANSCGSSFKATSRLSFTSVARYTSPIPPAPISARI
jgi:hypothetical protein